MDPDDEASWDTTDLPAGGDNLLNPVTNPSHPPATLSSLTEDQISTSTTNNGPDESGAADANNCSANLDPTSVEADITGGLEETDPQDIGDLDAEKLDQPVEDLGPREKHELEADEKAPDAPLPFGDDSGNAEEGMGRVSDEEPTEEVEDDGGREGLEQEKDADEEKRATEGEQDEERRQVEGEQDHVPDEDDHKEASGKEDPTEDPVILKRHQRTSLFREGLKLQETQGNTDEALRCYLAAITGLTEMEAFTELPQCLHQISDIYFEKKEYEKAVYFIQAEKMYYETALIDIVNLQKQLESKREEKGDETTAEEQERLPPEGPDSPEIIKAKEYENLAKLCLKESKPQLALEYCGKATKVYREVYGDEHPVTVGSLDLFTLIYADVGKKLYADAMQKFDAEEKDLEAKAGQPQSAGGDQVPAAEEESTSQLRQRSRNDAEQVAGQPPTETGTQSRTEFEPAPQPEEQDDWVTTCLLMLLFFLITVLVLLIMAYFYCLGNEQSSLCHQFKGDLSYWYMKIKHYYLGFGKR